MSTLFASGMAFTYVFGVIGLHRLNVFRMRRAAGGFPSLRWLDWDTLFFGLVPPARGTFSRRPLRVSGGGPLPKFFETQVAQEEVHRMEALCALVEGNVVGSEQWEALGFSGGELRWLHLLGKSLVSPHVALAELEHVDAATVAECYLREHLFLCHATHAFNLEWAVFVSKRRLGAALQRFGNHPALFYSRALASSLLGLNQSAVDDLARAVYFSHQHEFYLQAVVASHYVSETRPALSQQCLGTLKEE